MSLKELRNRKGVTQEALGQAIGVKQQCIHRYESGERKIPPEVAERIRAYFDLTVEEMWSILYKGRTDKTA